MKVGDLVKHEQTSAIGIILRLPQQSDRASGHMSVLKAGESEPSRWNQWMCEVVNESR